MSLTSRLRAWAARSPRLPASVALPLVAGLAVSGLVAVPGATAQGGLPGATVSTEDLGEDGAKEGVRVLLDEVDPVVVRPGQDVTLRGRLVNDGSSADRLTSLTVAAAPGPLASRSEVAGWLDGTDTRTAVRVLGDDAVGWLVRPGTERDFEITVPGSSLESLPQTPSVLGVELIASTGGEDDRVGPGVSGAGVLRTVLTSSGRPPFGTPLETTWVVPLTLPADRALSSPDDAAHAAAWLAAVGRDSAVRGWLDHLTVPDVTWLVDPAALVAHRPADGIAVPAPGPEDLDGDEADESDDGDDGDDDEVEDEHTTEDPDSTSPGDTDGATPTGEVGDPDEPSAEPTGSSTPGTTPPPTSPPAAGQTQDPTGRTGGESAGRTAAPDDVAVTTAPAPVPPPTQPEPEPEPEEDLAEALEHLHEHLAGLDPAALWWLPTDDPDLVALTREDTAPPAEILDDLLTRAPAEVRQLLRHGRQDVAWPALAAPTLEDVVAIDELLEHHRDGAGLAAVLVPRESFTADSSAPPRLGAVPVRERPEVVALGADSWTSGLVADSGEQAREHGAGAAVQHVLAHTLGTWLEAPGSERTLVIAPPRGTVVPPEVLDQLSEGWDQARWLTPVGAEEILDRAADLDPVGLSGVGPQTEVLGPTLAGLITPRDSPLTAPRAANLVDLHEDLEGLTEVLQDTDALRSWQPVLGSLWSTRWRDDGTPWVATWRVLRGEVRTTRDAIYLVPSNVNFLADQGVIHVTVVNDLPVAVEDVRLRIRPDNGRLQVTGQPEPVAIGPGSRASVPFQARAITRGETGLSVRITTPNGTSLGQDAQVAVLVQPTGVWIYWVLGGLAGLILVLGLRRNLRRRPAPTDPDRDADTTEAEAENPRGGAGTAYPGSSPSPGKENPQ